MTTDNSRADALTEAATICDRLASANERLGPATGRGSYIQKIGTASMRRCADAIRNLRAASPVEQHEAAPIPYDGLTEEFTEEVARLANDAPGIREAVSGALTSCNAIIAPSTEQHEAAPADDAEAMRDAAMRTVQAMGLVYTPGSDRWRPGVAQPEPPVADERAAPEWALGVTVSKQCEEMDAIREALELEEDCDYSVILDAIQELRDARASSPNAAGAEEIERCKCCGYLVTASEHRGCLRAAEPLNSSPPATASAQPAELAGECFIVIGHGETDIPEAKIVMCRDDLLDAVLSLIYGSASDAPEDLRVMYAQDLEDEHQWAADVWSCSFEIGGIVVWHVGLHPIAAPASAPVGLTEEHPLIVMIDNNIASIGNVAIAADEKSLTGLSKLLRKVGDTLSQARSALLEGAKQ
ncbi:hypothetical protein DIE15_12410 [Burkholderia sp. Bp9031]|uniref:hypothetical protein n=1 Tax=Burkholderia sp. Bp9031 TaxID=2184566 RepID=UPI000F5F2CD6|nr:hypothetical protein [Burkholderia sp. Bp9031]RQZ17268.1 hypothetical protein DIE15_12410 [Burkholderia sp. Bp9031]